MRTTMSTSTDNSYYSRVLAKLFHSASKRTIHCFQTYFSVKINTPKKWWMFNDKPTVGKIYIIQCTDFQCTMYKFQLNQLFISAQMVKINNNTSTLDILYYIYTNLKICTDSNLHEYRKRGGIARRETPQAFQKTRRELTHRHPTGPFLINFV